MNFKKITSATEGQFLLIDENGCDMIGQSLTSNEVAIAIADAIKSGDTYLGFEQEDGKLISEPTNISNGEIKKITIQTSVVSKSYHQKPSKFEGTFEQLQADLHRRSDAMVKAYNIVSLVNSTGNIDHAISESFKDGDVYSVDSSAKKTNIYLYGITIYISY